MKYCSECGSDQMTFGPTQNDHFPRYRCGACGMVHYQNPKIVVGCIVEWRDHVLLCRRAIEPRMGFWNLPGGYLENGETLEEGAVRETWEEAQAKVNIIRLHSVYNLPTVNQVFMHFLAELTEPSFAVTEESSEVKLFHKQHLPWDELAFHSNTFALQTYTQHSRQVDLPVFFGTLRK